MVSLNHNIEFVIGFWNFYIKTMVLSSKNLKHRGCCLHVKQAIFKSHRKCNKSKPFRFATGRKINCYFIVNVLDEETNYIICSNVDDQMKDYIIPCCPQKR